MGKTKLTLNKPIFVGFTVLDLSKLNMYVWYYGTLKTKIKIIAHYFRQILIAY